MTSFQTSLRQEVIEPDEDEDIGAQQIARKPEPQILAGLDLDGQTFAEFQNYSGVTFTGPVTLKNTRFGKGVSFAGARFLGPVNIKELTIASVKGSKATFAGAVFLQSLVVRKSTFYLADFTGANFAHSASFKYCRFRASAKFDQAVFSSSAAFENVIFHGAGNFNGAVFKSAFAFEKVVFRYSLSHARFTEAKFSEHAAFGGTRFCGDTVFKEAVFDSGASFDGAKFGRVGNRESDIDPDDTDDHEVADLIVSFENAIFRADDDCEVVSFRDARVGDPSSRRSVSFRNAQFRPNKLRSNERDPLKADFTELECYGDLDFRNADLHGTVTADFSQARFDHDADLSGAHFGGDALFEKAHFGGDVLVAQARFDKYPNFKQATFFHFPELSQATLPSRKDTWLGDERKQIIQRLAVLRRLAGRTDDKRTEFDLLVRELKLEGGLASGLYSMVSNYGQSWLRPTLWLLTLAVLFFPALYLAAGKVSIDLTWPIPTVSLDVAQTCIDHSEGNSVLAAVELSVRNALIVGVQDDQRNGRLGNCLVSETSDTRRLLSVLLQATQTVLTVVLIFFIGQAVRRRLQMR